jgi:hypothetical protein
MRKHTPGPWVALDGQDVIVKGGTEIRVIARCHAGHKAERAANAQLIASSPTMLTACEKAIKLLEIPTDKLYENVHEARTLLTDVVALAVKK